MSSRIYCVIPAYNEENNIISVIENLLPLVEKIIIVDDCSEDDTVKKLRSHFGNDKIIVLEHLINRGQGAALRTGTEYALRKGADIMVHFDADGQFMAEDIVTVTTPIIKGNADIVFGSRFLGKESNMPWPKKKIIMPLARMVNLIFLGIRLTDPQSGFRAFSCEAAKKIKWQQDRMAHCSEILFESVKSQFKIKEVPVTVVYHDYGQRLAGGIKIIKELIIGLLLKS